MLNLLARWFVRRMNVMACIDAHAKACKPSAMEQPLLTEVERFITATGLSDHRAGMVLCKNGKLVERLRAGRRIWPETAQMVRDAIARETAARCAPEASEAAE
jgi:hypothetical protein